MALVFISVNGITIHKIYNQLFALALCFIYLTNIDIEIGAYHIYLIFEIDRLYEKKNIFT